MSIPEHEQVGSIQLSVQGVLWLIEAHTMSRRYMVRRHVPVGEVSSAIEMLLDRDWEEFKQRYAELSQPEIEAYQTAYRHAREVGANDIDYCGRQPGRSLIGDDDPESTD